MADLDSVLARAELLLARLEAVLPHPPAAPDWAASIAFRYRKRGSSGVLEPVRHVATIRLDALVDAALQRHANEVAAGALAAELSQLLRRGALARDPAGHAGGAHQGGGAERGGRDPRVLRERVEQNTERRTQNRSILKPPWTTFPSS